MTDKEKSKFVLHIWDNHKSNDGCAPKKDKPKLTEKLAATIIQRWARRHVIKGILHRRFDQSNEEGRNLENIGSLSAEKNNSTGNVKPRLRGPSFDQSKPKNEIFDIESLSMVRINEMPNLNNRELNPLSDYSQDQTMANVSSGRGKKGSDESMEIMTFAMNTHRREKSSNTRRKS